MKGSAVFTSEIFMWWFLCRSLSTSSIWSYSLVIDNHMKLKLDPPKKKRQAKITNYWGHLLTAFGKSSFKIKKLIMLWCEWGLLNVIPCAINKCTTIFLIQCVFMEIVLSFQAKYIHILLLVHLLNFISNN